MKLKSLFILLLGLLVIGCKTESCEVSNEVPEPVYEPVIVNNTTFERFLDKSLQNYEQVAFICDFDYFNAKPSSRYIFSFKYYAVRHKGDITVKLLEHIYECEITTSNTGNGVINNDNLTKKSFCHGIQTPVCYSGDPLDEYFIEDIKLELIED